MDSVATANSTAKKMEAAVMSVLRLLRQMLRHAIFSIIVCFLLGGGRMLFSVGECYSPLSHTFHVLGGEKSFGELAVKFQIQIFHFGSVAFFVGWY